MRVCVEPGNLAPRVAEFFAGIGLVRMALEQEGCRVVFANDLSAEKRRLYTLNFDASHYVLADVRDVRGDDVPDIEIATASFPCTDLSLAGERAGLRGSESSAFWEFARVIDEMGKRRPLAILLENVAGLSTSSGGEDLRSVVARLNDLGYWCDLLVVDARWFVPQSRPRLFIVGSLERIAETMSLSHTVGDAHSPAGWARPAWTGRFAAQHPELKLQALPLDPPPPVDARLANVVERLPDDDACWWDQARLQAFLGSLSSINTDRLASLREGRGIAWAAAYRRTRAGRPMWEIRADAISGCLRTARGGSSKQALVQAGVGDVRVRWMTAREYARLQGAPHYRFGDARPLQVMFGFGDAVCVPAVAWLARTYLTPLVFRVPTGVEAALAVS